MNETELAKLLRDNPDLRQANMLDRIAERIVSKESFAKIILPVNGKPQDKITITLPWPPSLNKLYRHTSRGVLLSAAAVRFKAEAHAIMTEAGITNPITEPCSMTVHQYRPRNAGDADNYLKLTCDTLQGYAYVNDKQLVELHIYQHTDKLNPRLEITVTKKGTK